jgi:hypothetical protein
LREVADFCRLPPSVVYGLDLEFADWLGWPWGTCGGVAEAAAKAPDDETGESAAIALCRVCDLLEEFRLNADVERGVLGHVVRVARRVVCGNTGLDTMY